MFKNATKFENRLLVENAKLKKEIEDLEEKVKFYRREIKRIRILADETLTH